MNSREKHQICVCTECLTIGQKITVMQGSWIVRVILYMCGIVPGIAYSAWQESTKKNVCPGCKKDSMIPVDAPKGRQLVINSELLIDEKSIDATGTVTVHDVGAKTQSEPTLNSETIINRTVGLFVVCGLILSVLMWWKFGAINEHSEQLVPELQIPIKEAAARSEEPTSYYPKDMPSNVRLLVDKWSKSYDACREGDESNIATMKLCDEEPQLSSAIKKLGWCYGEDAASMAERKWKECIARSGEPISYSQFYAKARTSMQPGKRYRFQASLNQYGCLDAIDYSGNQSLCEADTGNFDDNSEKLKFFESGVNYKGEVVAGMVYGSNGGGVIAIYRLPEIDTGSAKNYRVLELEKDTSEPTIPAYVAPGKDFKQETPSINQDPSKQEDLESDKTENTSSADTPHMMVLRMLEYALDDGGLSHESEIQQIKLQIESAPKPVKGNKKAARALNDRGLASSKEGDFNNAVKMFEEANKLDKSDIEIISNLGFSYFKQGNLDSAQQAIITTLTMSPGRAVAWTNLGEV
jgi:tetratricopeptide (TPR) repeat protein